MVTPAWAPDRGELVWLKFSPQAGHEQAGRRPALVLSPRAYNERVGLMLCCPVTSRAKGYPFEVALPSDLAVSGVVLADQVRCHDWRARSAKSICAAPSNLVDRVVALAVSLLA